MVLINPYQRARLLLILGAAVSLFIFWWAGKLFHIPYYHGLEGNLLGAPSATINLLVIALAIIACTTLGTFIAGSVRFDGGLFAAAIGLAMLSMRGGTTGQVFRSAADSAGPQASPAVLLSMAGELAILSLFLLAAWSVLWILQKRGCLKSDEYRDGLENVATSSADRITATAMQFIVTAGLLLLLCRSDAKAQTLSSVAIASFLGTLVTHSTFPVACDVYFWLATLLVGIAGYVITYFHPEGWQVGELRSIPAALARPLPLDYASFGVAASILGYWTSRRWHRERMPEDSDEPDKVVGTT